MDQVAAPFAQSLATLQKEGECVISFIIGSLIYESRNNFAKQAIQLDCDYVLFLDSDMIFPQDLIPKMLRHMEAGKDIVSGVYYRRRLPFTPVLFKTLHIDGADSSWEGYDNYPKDGPFELDAVGMGCCMIKKDVLLEIGLNEGGQWFTPLIGFGEDLSFCSRAKKYGFKVWADPEIQCGHVGQVIVDRQLYESNIQEPTTSEDSSKCSA